MQIWRSLSPAEEQEFRDWAVQHFDPNVDVNHLWHPVVKAVWFQMLAEYWEQVNRSWDDPQEPA